MSDAVGWASREDWRMPIGYLVTTSLRMCAGSASPVVYAELPRVQHGFDRFHSIRFEQVVDDNSLNFVTLCCLVNTLGSRRIGSTRTARWSKRMTLAVILAEGDVAGHGQAVLNRVRKAEWPSGHGRQVAEALWSLHDLLGIYDGILNEVIDPAAEFPELEHQAGALERALTMVTEDVNAWAAELDRLVPPRGSDG
jgi:hypothetical protein